ncbi:MAG TPA: hypothetical protein VFR85_03735 [Anaeromyxobacteraceae bacterium]|nr:hypothetical protein [Anaeromyxobacteraceae bacterium]
MPSPAARRRVEIHASARARPAEFLRLDPESFRFRLGTSLADFALPVQVAPDAAAIVRGAAAEVALLLATVHARLAPEGELDALYLREDYATLPRAEDLLGPAGGGPDLRAAAQLGAAAHPALGGGITCAWMGPGGKGRSLTALWIEVVRRAVGEMTAGRDREPTPLLAVAALHGALLAAGEAVREALPGPPLGQYLRSAAMAALWVAARTGLTRAWRDAGRRVEDPLLVRLEAALSPLALLGGRGQVAAGGSTLYGLELSAAIPRADDLSARLAQGMDAEAAAAELEHGLGADDEAARRAELLAAQARLREALSAAVAAAEAAGQGGAGADLRALLASPGGLSALADEAARKALQRRLADAEPAFPAGEGRSQLEAAARALKAFKGKEPAAAFGLKRAEARREYAACAAALLCDAALERMAQPLRRVLLPRTGAEAEGGAEAEWEAGRLYRLSARPAPILQASRDRPLGHLFADVKDFTRRTALLGQAAMAEFLRREFYLPILGAAKEHFGGMQHLSDRGGVSVNNLLGDAISLSGDVEALVAVAGEVRRLMGAYGRRLEREISAEATARQVAAIEEAFRAGLAGAARDAAEAGAALERAAPGTPAQAEAAARAVRAGAARARLEAERERAVARARGEGLEAGLFISYGPAPLMVTIDDEVFGKSRVAIADKINESARGTARAAAARARADAGLAAERAQRQDPRLSHAWSVFVGQPLLLAIPPEAEAAALAAARGGDLAAAMRAVAAPVREAVAQAARDAADERGDIYNGGVALSEGALEAFLGAVARARTVRRAEVPPQRIPEELKRRWYFGSSPETLLACFHLDGRLAEVFRYVGKAAFKGIGDVPVWELCAETGAGVALAGAVFRG